MKKYKCSCGITWFTDELNPLECPDEYPDTKHVVKEVKRLSADDYAEMWGSDLESANRHDMTEMPSQILQVLTENIKDEKIVRKIMKQFCEDGLGI